MYLEKIKDPLIAATRAGNLPEVKKLVELWEQAEALDRRLADLNGAAKPPPAPLSNPSPNLQQLIEITQGALTHGYLTLSRPLDKKLIELHRTLTIEIPATGQTFQSPIDRRNKVLQERWKIREFFSSAKIKPGDYVLLEVIGKDHIRLTKASPLPPNAQNQHITRI